MNKLITTIVRPTSLFLTGIGIGAVGVVLADSAFDSNDPRAFAGGCLILLAVLAWLVGLSITVASLLFKLVHRRGARTAMSTSVATPSAPLRKPGLMAALVVAIVFTAIAGGAAVIVGPFTDAQTLSQADPAMTALADEAGMSREGKLIFLRTHPQLVSDSGMQSVCADNTAANNSDGFIEQGCYVPATNRIYLRHMPDNLHNLVVATAAYEMLHPVYIALHASDQATALDHAIEDNFTRINDTNLNEQVDNFAKTEPGARYLELFSLLGTGYTNLSSGLARYYVPYFNNLSATVAANDQVRQLFADSHTKITQLSGQIKQYDSLATNAYNTSVAWAHSGSQYWDDYYYNEYRQYLNQENALIDQYNQELESYNALVTEFDGTQPVREINPAQTQSL